MPSIIVFSKDRPMQLHGYLESLLIYSDAQQKDITVLYCQTPGIEYGRVIESFPHVRWVKEKVFHSDLVNAINDSRDFIMFGCDDVLFIGAFSLEFAVNILHKNSHIFGFSFRLGVNIQPNPKSLIQDQGYIEWSWKAAKESHYNYPWELMGTLYRKTDVQKMLSKYNKPIKSPNYFEGDFAVNAEEYIDRPNLACLNDRGKLIDITVNAVQDTHPNGFDDKKKTDIFSLNNLYNINKNKLDVTAISCIKNNTIHVGSEFFLLANYDKNWESSVPKKVAMQKKASRLKLFAKNIGYLFRYDLKKIANESISRGELNTILDGVSYEIADDLSGIVRPHIKSSEETIKELVEKKASFCRFGDGEFCLIKGEDIPYQKAEPKLSQRLVEVFQSNIDNIFIGIPYFYYSTLRDIREYPKSFTRSWVASNRSLITGLSSPGKQYYDTACSQLYALYESYDFKTYFEGIKEIWRGRDIAIICGETVFNTIGINIFDCANSIQYQYAPRLNAFDIYDELLIKARQINKDKLIIIILGPTATVLAYDLARMGYQAIDLGHIAKDYDFYSRKVEHNAETISNFIKPD